MAKLTLKNSSVEPHLLHIVVALANTAQTLSSPSEVVITAGVNGAHKAGSLHYALRAVDVRSKNFTPEGLQAFIQALKTALGPNYDILLECAGTPNEHLHIEFDPKR